MNTSRGKSTPITAAVASLVGSSLEWFDFYIYATAAALVFNQVFFPSYDPLVGTLLAFGTFAVAAIMRPLGGLICGHYGDRIGRKSLLVWTVVAMGAGTFLIGCLPGYASIGIAAPIALLVLRCVQAMAFGGEWAGAILVAVEHAPKKSKGFFGSFPQIGSPIGLFLSTGAFALLSALPKEDFLAWGWRIPFLASAVLILVGLVFRLRLLESPEFAETVRKGEIVKQPIVEVLRSRLRQVLVGGGAILCTTVAFFVQIVFVVTYATQSAGVPRPVVLNAILAATAVELVLLPLFAAWADRIGVKPVAILGAVMTIVFSFPFFWLVDMGTATAITVACCVAMFGISALFAVLPAFASNLFEPRVRYSGVAIAFGLAGIIAGSTPLIATSLYAWTNSYWPIAVYMMVIGLVSIICIVAASPAAAAATTASEPSSAAAGVPS